MPYAVVSLPDFKSNDLPSMEGSSEYPMFAEWVHEDEHALLNTTSLEGGGQCDGFPTFRRPVEVNEEGSPPGAFQSVFGRSEDAFTGEEVVFIYDPHLAMYENTVQNPVRRMNRSFERSGESAGYQKDASTLVDDTSNGSAMLIRTLCSYSSPPHSAFFVCNSHSSPMAEGSSCSTRTTSSPGSRSPARTPAAPS